MRRAMRKRRCRCGCAPGRRPIRISISPRDSPGGASNVAAALSRIVGFVTVDTRTLYLDQLVVAPEFWGAGVGSKLIAEAKSLSPRGLNLDVNTDNSRAITFYEKVGFVITGDGFNAFSGRPVHHMSWR